MCVYKSILEEGKIEDKMMEPSVLLPMMKQEALLGGFWLFVSFSVDAQQTVLLLGPANASEKKHSPLIQMIFLCYRGIC
ncbi:hypothetical protein OPV22_020842 [Ensete ventricosum]|uniref:Uncharacterized protein n=1 Tax=Ensete ventricosum TaxID=4639 RepID=A0AAV8QNZ3_ENSVE|nr:hypothetical protein OPV22_020842 [Ensete ventricosum]